MICSGRRIHPTKTHPDFYLWGYLKYRVSVHKPQSIPDLKREIKTTIKAIRREGMQEVHRQFCSQNSRFLLAPRRSFRAYFLSSNKSSILKSIGLIFYSFQKLNILLMYVKFCNHNNKTLEIIQILVITSFFGSPCS